MRACISNSNVSNDTSEQVHVCVNWYKSSPFEFRVCVKSNKLLHEWCCFFVARACVLNFEVGGVRQVIVFLFLKNVCAHAFPIRTCVNNDTSEHVHVCELV